MTNKNIKNKIKGKKGSLMLETLVAALIFAFGVLSLMGLQTQAISNNSTSTYRAEAAFLAEQIVSQIWLDQTNIGSYGSGGNANKAAWLGKIQNTLPNGNGTITVTNGNQVLVTVTWQMPGALAASQYQTMSTIVAAE